MSRFVRLLGTGIPMLLAGVLCSTALSAQSVSEGAVLAVNTAMTLPQLNEWAPGFAAIPSNVLVSYAGVRDSTGTFSDTLGAQIAARVRSRGAGQTFRLAPRPQDWGCSRVPNDMRVECALEQQPYFAEVTGPYLEADTVYFIVVMAKRPAPGKRQYQTGSLVATAMMMRERSGWRVVRTAARVM